MKMKKIIPLLLITVMLLTTLTSCLTTEKMGDYVGNMLGSAGVDKTQQLINDVAREAVLSGILVKSTHYTGLSKNESQGSGVIFNSKYGSVFYALTNYHVVANEDSDQKPIYTVTDAYDNVYSAILVAGSKELDLAILRFGATVEMNEKLRLAPLARENARVATQVLAIGNPGGLHNSITVGDIISYKDVEADELPISVIYHTAPLEHGSSGGGIFNSDGELVGINYAIGETQDGDNKISFAVPIEEVIGFITANGLMPTANDSAQ